MRRSGSSSCMLRSKAESDGEPLSVTILNTEQLPTYSCERFYMLSELETNSQSIVFLDGYDCDETIDTTDSSLTDPKAIPQNLILYLLWTDERMSARVFAETVLYAELHKLDALADLAGSGASGTSEIRKRSLSEPNFGNDQARLIRQEHPETSSSDNDEEEEQGRNSSHLSSSSTSSAPRTTANTAPAVRQIPTSKVYVVVDKLQATPEDASPEEKHRLFDEQVDMAKKLARMVSTHPTMRRLCQGITVGVSNHQRAAPGLEACMDAVILGSSDRRRYGRDDHDRKSWMGIAVSKQADLLGMQEPDVTDAAQGVLQCRVCAEWSGRGTLQTFASSVHLEWRTEHGVPNPQPLEARMRRRFGHRRIRFHDDLQSSAFDMVSAMIAFTVWTYGVLYAWQNLRELLAGGGGDDSRGVDDPKEDL